MLRNVINAVVLALALTATVTPPACAAQSDPAAQQVERFYGVLLDTMKRGPALGMRGREQALGPAVDAAFDLPTMMKFIVGPSWATMSDADHKALVEAFRRMTVANYASNFDSFHGEHFDFDPDVQTRNGDRIVQTTLVPGNGKSVPLIYRMRQVGDQWKIIDVFLNGYVSELATRRSDFASTLASGGASALVKKMDALSDNLTSGGKPANG